MLILKCLYVAVAVAIGVFLWRVARPENKGEFLGFVLATVLWPGIILLTAIDLLNDIRAAKQDGEWWW